MFFGFPVEPWLVWGVFALIGFTAIFFGGRIVGVVVVPQDSIAIVNKRFALTGANRRLPDGRLIALKGEAGIQADPLPPGVHFRYWPWQYEIQLQKFITIAPDQIGIVEARDGAPTTVGRVLARHVDCDRFQDARGFLERGGERGPQMTIIPPGTYRINTALFNVSSALALEIPDDKIGVVTTKEGTPLPTGEIAGMEVQGH